MRARRLRANWPYPRFDGSNEMKGARENDALSVVAFVLGTVIR